MAHEAAGAGQSRRDHQSGRYCPEVSAQSRSGLGAARGAPLTKVRPLRINRHGVIRYLSEDEESRLRTALDALEDRRRAERASANAWRRDRRYPEWNRSLEAAGSGLECQAHIAQRLGDVRECRCSRDDSQIVRGGAKVRCLRVTPSGFYAWCQRPESGDARLDRQLRILIGRYYAGQILPT